MIPIVNFYLRPDLDFLNSTKSVRLSVPRPRAGGGALRCQDPGVGGRPYRLPHGPRGRRCASQLATGYPNHPVSAGRDRRHTTTT